MHVGDVMVTIGDGVPSAPATSVVEQKVVVWLGTLAMAGCAPGIRSSDVVGAKACGGRATIGTCREPCVGEISAIGGAAVAASDDDIATVLGD